MKKRNKRKVLNKGDNCWLVAMNVIYNIKDPRQKELLEQADTVPNFSGFVKHLQEAALYGWDSRVTHQDIRQSTRELQPDPKPPNS